VVHKRPPSRAEAADVPNARWRGEVVTQVIGAKSKSALLRDLAGVL
jgi:hypothetical protein